MYWFLRLTEMYWSRHYLSIDQKKFVPTPTTNAHKPPKPVAPTNLPKLWLKLKSISLVNTYRLIVLINTYRLDPKKSLPRPL